MGAEAIIASIAIGVTVVGALIVVLIRLFVAIEHLTGATERLIITMDDHDDRIDMVEGKIVEHEKRIGKIETTHEIKGCIR